jgi:UDP-glucose 4-epimerase
MVKTTLLTNIYNEEYLLPFWLIHHRDMFDKLIVIDYGCTDRSIEIVNQLWPGADIRKTRNADFDAKDIDDEFMDIENTLEGVKMVLNTTEFLFCKRPLKEIFPETGHLSYGMRVVSPYSKNERTPANNHELFSSFLDEDVVFHQDRHWRFIHTFPNGAYQSGRHAVRNWATEVHDDMYVAWLGFYPLNESTIARKLQIKHKMSQNDKERLPNSHHLYDRAKIFEHNEEKVRTGSPLSVVKLSFHAFLTSQFANKTFIVTGGCGFIGSHMVDKLLNQGHKVVVIDNLLSGNKDNLDSRAIFEQGDITNFDEMDRIFGSHGLIDGVFHFAAIARTPWCIDDPLLCYKTNVMGTLHILEASRKHKVKRVVLSSSNVVYAYLTPYRTSKEALEDLGETYTKMYGMSVISLRYSNVYGKRQSETGPSPNVFAALRKSKKELGKLVLTGDGTQTRNYTHVSDIVNGNLLAMFSTHCGALDLCTGVPIELNEAARYFDCPIEYIADRPGDVKHIVQSPEEAWKVLGWKAVTTLENGIKDVITS